MRVGLLAVLIAVVCLCAGQGVQALDVKTAILRVDYKTLLPISRYELIPPDLGFAGAVLGDEDNNTTGSFLGHKFETQTVATTPDKAQAAMAKILADGIRLVVVLARTDELLKLADQAAKAGALVFNASDPDDALRDDQCRANLLHIAPSNAMNADAIAEFAIWKKWTRWFLVEGSNPPDQAIAAAYKRSAKKFGAKIVADRVLKDTGGARQTDTGIALVQRQIPLDTQGVPDYDVLIAADGTDYFAKYLPYNTWDPRPVMGSAGLWPVTMHGAHEAWGATQYQNRFEKSAHRYIHPEDYNVWLALRVIGEAVVRANDASAEGIRKYVLSDAFDLAAFKGQKVTFRTWNGQLRQPILLYDGMVTVSVSPQDGFLHQRSPLDTLGLDKPESRCAAFN